MDYAKLFGAWCSYFRAQPRADTPVVQTCQHGNDPADCEVLCASCKHSCRGHGNLCGAAWATRDPGPYERYTQHLCPCTEFR